MKRRSPTYALSRSGHQHHHRPLVRRRLHAVLQHFVIMLGVTSSTSRLELPVGRDGKIKAISRERTRDVKETAPRPVFCNRFLRRYHIQMSWTTTPYLLYCRYSKAITQLLTTATRDDFHMFYKSNIFHGIWEWFLCVVGRGSSVRARVIWGANASCCRRHDQSVARSSEGNAFIQERNFSNIVLIQVLGV